MTSRSLPTSTSKPPLQGTLPRTKSHLIPSKPANAPIPPSLLAKAPHLLSPHSMFYSAASDPRPPSQEDEAWLGDTVPVSPSKRHDGKSTSGPTFVVRRSDKAESCTR